MRFLSTFSRRASIEPVKIVMIERTRIAVCTQVPRSMSRPKSWKVQRMIASTPPLVMRPDSTALAGDGATGWASVSHICSGTIPAFAPKPRIIRNAATSRVFGSPTSCPPWRAKLKSLP